LTQVNKFLNNYIAILAVIALIGILFVPAVSAGKTINYGPIQWTMKTIPAVKYTQSSLQPTIPEKTPAAINVSTDPGSTNPQSFALSNLNYPTIPKDYAIRIAVESIDNSIILTSDPVATLTTPSPGNSVATNIKKQVWVVTLSGTPTDPNAWVGRIRYIDSRTGKIASPPSMAGMTVTIDARTGKILSSAPFFP